MGGGPLWLSGSTWDPGSLVGKIRPSYPSLGAEGPAADQGMPLRHLYKGRVRPERHVFYGRNSRSTFNSGFFKVWSRDRPGLNLSPHLPSVCRGSSETEACYSKGLFFRICIFRILKPARGLPLLVDGWYWPPALAGVSLKVWGWETEFMEKKNNPCFPANMPDHYRKGPHSLWPHRRQWPVNTLNLWPQGLHWVRQFISAQR